MTARSTSTVDNNVLPSTWYSRTANVWTGAAFAAGGGCGTAVGAGCGAVVAAGSGGGAGCVAVTGGDG